MVIFHGYEIDYIILYLLLPIKNMVIFHGTGVFFWRKSRLQCVSCLDTGCWASGLDIGDTDKVSHLAMENRLETAASQLFLSTRIWYPKMWNSQIP